MDTHRVAVAVHEPEPGGATRAIVRLLPLLEERGWRFTFWVPGHGGVEQELRELGHDVTARPRDLRFTIANLRQPPGIRRRLAGVPGYVRSWRTWLREQEPELVHANSLLALPEAATRPRSGPATLLHVHEMLPSGPKGWVAGLLVHRVSDAVVAVSEASARRLRSFGIDVTVIHNGVDVPPPRPPREAGGRVVVGTVGTVSRRKGSDLFVEAARLLSREGHGIEFRMVGEKVAGAESSWASSVVDAAERSGVRYRGLVDVPQELADWDVFVLPSRRDPFPLAVLEAMSMAIPVVATRVDGVREQLEPDAGLLVAPEDAHALASAIARLAKDPTLRASLGVAGRHRVEERFTLDRQAEALHRTYVAVRSARRGTVVRSGRRRAA